MEKSKNTEPYERVGEYLSIFMRGNRWYAHYRLDGKPVRQSLKTKNKKQARIKALAIERELVNDDLRRPQRAPFIKDVIDEYLSHLEAQRRSKSTIKKYRFALRLALELATKRGISRINQIDLAFIDAFRLERTTHRVKPTRVFNNG
jgi:hypothetical protein